jgi:putative oxidoreductase
MRPFLNMNVVLWIVQVFLGLFIGLASGLPKLILPIEMLALPLPLPELFVRCIGIAEVLGAIALILPGVLHVRTGVTPLAAACLVLLTMCATVYQLMAGQPESAVFASVIGLIAAFVAYGRWRVAPLREAPRHAAHGMAGRPC